MTVPSNQRLGSAPCHRVACTAGAVVVGLLAMDAVLLVMLSRASARIVYFPVVAGWFPLLIILSVTIGAMTGQVLLAAGYAALGDGSSPKRVLYTTFVLAVACNVLLLFSVCWFGRRWDESVTFFLIPMFCYSALQIPLWAFRMYRGWLVRSPWNPGGTLSMRFRFTVAHLLGWSLFLSLPLCISPVLAMNSGTRDWLFAFFMGLLACGLFLWCVWLVLRSERLLIWRFLATGVVMPGVALIEVIAGQVLVESFWPNWDELIALALVNATGFLVVGGCLFIARRLGYRLERRGDMPVQLPSHFTAA